MEIIRFGMGLKRRLGVHNTFILLVLGNIATVICINGQSLDCTNDFDKTMFCHFGGENCTEYRMTLVNDSWYRDKSCGFKQCDNGQCCCSIQMPYFIADETFKARVWKGSKNIDSKPINVKGSVKPKTPTIISVNESMGNFKVVWLTNVDDILSTSLTAEVTYRVKGSTKKESVRVNQTAANGRNDYEIQGRLLEPRTTYVVSVRSYTAWSNKFSDSSNEKEFTTSMSSDTPFTIISLCVAAVLISGVIYGCYIKLRSKWLDTVEKCPNPKLLDMHPSEQKFLKTAPPIFSSVCVEPLSDDRRLWFKHPLKDSSDGSLQQSSGIGSGSSCLRDANSEPADIISEVQDATRKALSKIIISTTSPLTTGLMTDFPQDSSLLCAPHNLCDVQDEDMSSGLSAFLNKTYSIPIPGDPVQTTTDISEVQIEMPCETAHRPSEGATVISTYQQAAPCPPITLPFSLIPTDISYQPCNINSGTCSFQDSGISSVSSGTNTTPSCDPVCEVEAACEGFENGKIDAEAIVSDENPCSVPAESHSIPAVDYDYQPFQHLVEPSVFISDMKGGEKEEHCNHPEDPYIKTPQTV